MPTSQQSDPLVFAARVARLRDAALIAEWRRLQRAGGADDWRQAVADEIAARSLILVQEQTPQFN